MTFSLAEVLKAMAKAGALLLIINEIRGVILVAPVFYGIYQAGGTAAAIWLALCSLGGIALSVAVPAVLLKRLTGTKSHPQLTS